MVAARSTCCENVSYLLLNRLHRDYGRAVLAGNINFDCPKLQTKSTFRFAAFAHLTTSIQKNAYLLTGSAIPAYGELRESQLFSRTFLSEKPFSGTTTEYSFGLHAINVGARTLGVSRPKGRGL